eukprot:761430-Hanusia_phi.AAC.6
MPPSKFYFPYSRVNSLRRWRQGWRAAGASSTMEGGARKKILHSPDPPDPIALSLFPVVFQHWTGR